MVVCGVVALANSIGPSTQMHAAVGQKLVASSCARSHADGCVGVCGVVALVFPWDAPRIQLRSIDHVLMVVRGVVGLAFPWDPAPRCTLRWDES